jgi:hypothetical protein
MDLKGRNKMLYDFKICHPQESRSRVINFIKTQRSIKPFTVVDVGGSFIGWSNEVTDCIVDFSLTSENRSQKVVFNFDITGETGEGWTLIKKYVKENGNFDFCICTHTLEDIINPVFVVRQIESIAKSGFISFPSKYAEFSRLHKHLGLHGRGYFHHRWVFDKSRENSIIAYSKVNYLEERKFDALMDASWSCAELSCYWDTSIELEYANNNCMGTDLETFCKIYDPLFEYNY